ncbi:MAG: GNAT family protein [Acidobacteriota bacterium]
MIEGDHLPTLTAERVRLRWLTEDDVPALFDIFSNSDVARYWSSPVYESQEAAAKLLDEIHDYFRRRNLFQWGVALNESDRVIGTCTLADVDADNLRAEIGFALHRDYWGGGYISEALTTLFHYAFEDLGLRRIEADVDPRNSPSIRTLERFGFQREGYLRERWQVAGEVQDSLFYGLLAREWRQTRAQD